MQNIEKTKEWQKCKGTSKFVIIFFYNSVFYLDCGLFLLSNLTIGSERSMRPENGKKFGQFQGPVASYHFEIHEK